MADLSASLQEARKDLEAACEHVKQCNLLYGAARVDHGLPTERGWAVIPLCDGLNAILDALEQLHQRVSRLERESEARARSGTL